MTWRIWTPASGPGFLLFYIIDIINYLLAKENKIPVERTFHVIICLCCLGQSSQGSGYHSLSGTEKADEDRVGESEKEGNEQWPPFPPQDLPNGSLSKNFVTILRPSCGCTLCHLDK